MLSFCQLQPKCPRFAKVSHNNPAQKPPLLPFKILFSLWIMLPDGTDLGTSILI